MICGIHLFGFLFLLYSFVCNSSCYLIWLPRKFITLLFINSLTLLLFSLSNLHKLLYPRRIRVHLFVLKCNNVLAILTCEPRMNFPKDCFFFHPKIHWEALFLGFLVDQTQSIVNNSPISIYLTPPFQVYQYFLHVNVSYLCWKNPIQAQWTVPYIINASFSPTTLIS